MLFLDPWINYQDFLVELSTGNNQSVFAIDHTMGVNADGNGNQLFVAIGASRNSTTSLGSSDYMVQIATTNSDLVSIRSNSNDMLAILGLAEEIDAIFDSNSLEGIPRLSFEVAAFSALNT